MRFLFFWHAFCALDLPSVFLTPLLSIFSVIKFLYTHFNLLNRAVFYGALEAASYLLLLFFPLHPLTEAF